jgi:hypothetical protein
VTTRRESQTIHYSLASEKVSRLIGLLYELYCAPACADVDATATGAKRRKR